MNFKGELNNSPHLLIRKVRFTTFSKDLMSKGSSETFIPYRSRQSHWGESTYRPIIQNVPTVLPADLPPPLLHMILLRIQKEEAQYKFSHLSSEVDYAVWRENSLDLSTWSGKISDAKKARATELLSEELRQVQNEFDQLFPISLPLPASRTEPET